MVYKGLKWHPTGSNGFVAAHDVAPCMPCCLGRPWNAGDTRYPSECRKPVVPICLRPNGSGRFQDCHGLRDRVEPWMMGAAWRLSAMALEYAFRVSSAKATKGVRRHHPLQTTATYESSRLEKTLGGGHGIDLEIPSQSTRSFPETAQSVSASSRGAPISASARLDSSAGTEMRSMAVSASAASCSSASIAAGLTVYHHR